MNRTKQKHRFHPIIILYYMRWLLVLGIAPILRGVLSSFQENTSFITTGIWIDLTIMSLVVLAAFFRWFLSFYYCNEEYIEVSQGIFFSQKTRMPWSRISVLKVRSPFYLRPFRANIIKADTLGGSYRNADINICISSTNCNILLELYSNSGFSSEIEKVFKPKPLSLFNMALLSTNNFIGVFYLATFISQSGKILGEEFPDQIIGNFEEFARTADPIISPAAFVIAIFLVFTWLVGVILTLLKHYDYRILCKENRITASGGLVSKQSYTINKNEINYLIIRQNILTFFFRVYSLYVSAVGCGKERSDITCLIPNESKNSFYQHFEYLFPDHKPTKLSVRPSRGGFSRFMLLPFSSSVLILLLTLLGIYFVPQWTDFIKFVGAMLLVLSISLLIVGIVDYSTSGIGTNGNYYTMRYATRFTFHNLIIPKESIVKIKIQQSLIQTWFGNCTAFVYTKSESQKRHKCKNVNRKEIEALFNV